MAIRVTILDIKTVKAKLGEFKEIKASLSDVLVSAGEMPIYTGDYTITPKIEEQILETENKQMSENVVVKAIPRYDVSNSMGGITVSIARMLEE